MQYFIDCDHHGIELKGSIIKYLKEQNIPVQDLNFGIENPYPLVANNMALQVLAAPGSLGILICKTGIGMSIVANKYSGIYANNCTCKEECLYFRKANNGNILCLGTAFVTEDVAIKLCHLFITTSFDSKNTPRLQLIESIS